MTDNVGIVLESQTEPSPRDDAPGKGLLCSGLLQDPLAERKDIAMLSNIIKRNRWPIPDSVKPVLINRLCSIAAKDSVSVMTKGGLVAIDGPADTNSVAAIRVLALLEAQNQRDEHKLADAESDRSRAGDTYNLGCVGSISLGQEPLTPEDAKRQARDVLARVRARLGEVPPSQPEVIIDVDPGATVHSSPQPGGLIDL